MVERQEKGRTITIKINGQHRFFEEKAIADKEMNKEDLENDYIIEEKSLPKNANYLSFDETAATKEIEDDDSFDWILPDESADSEIMEYQIVTQTKKNSKKEISSLGKSFKKNNQSRFLTSIFITVAFAILLGTSFGLIMLKIVKTEKIAETEQPTIAEPAAEEEQQTEGLETVVLMPISTFVIQGGVFSNVEAAKQIQEDYRQSGIPAKVIEMNGQAVLYLGVASSIEDAKEIGNQLKSKGYEVFAKPITFDEKSIEGLLSEEKKIIGAVPAIYQVMAEAATEGAMTNTLSAGMVENAESQMANIISVEEDQLINEGVLALIHELKNAYRQLQVYKETNESETLMKLQQHLLEFIANYYSMQNT